MNSLCLFDNSNLSPFPASACGASVGQLIHPIRPIGHLPPKGGRSTLREFSTRCELVNVK